MEVRGTIKNNRATSQSELELGFLNPIHCLSNYITPPLSLGRTFFRGCGAQGQSSKYPILHF
jgi:hypothetical protein